MMSEDTTFEYDVAEYMLTRFVDYIRTTRKNVHIVLLPSGEKSKMQILTHDRMTDLIKDFSRYIDKRLNKPEVNSFFYGKDKPMSARFKNR